MHVFTWQFSFLFRAYLATVPTNTVAYMWNTDRKAVFVKIIDALAVVKLMTGLPYRHLQGSEDAITCQCARHGNAVAQGTHSE